MYIEFLKYAVDENFKNSVDRELKIIIKTYNNLPIVNYIDMFINIAILTKLSSITDNNRFLKHFRVCLENNVFVEIDYMNTELIEEKNYLQEQVLHKYSKILNIQWQQLRDNLKKLNNTEECLSKIKTYFDDNKCNYLQYNDNIANLLYYLEVFINPDIYVVKGVLNTLQQDIVCCYTVNECLHVVFYNASRHRREVSILKKVLHYVDVKRGIN